jgi:hypothetical protein
MSSSSRLRPNTRERNRNRLNINNSNIIDAPAFNVVETRVEHTETNGGTSSQGMSREEKVTFEYNTNIVNYLTNPPPSFDISLQPLTSRDTEPTSIFFHTTSYFNVKWKKSDLYNLNYTYTIRDQTNGDRDKDILLPYYYKIGIDLRDITSSEYGGPGRYSDMDENWINITDIIDTTETTYSIQNSTTYTDRLYGNNPISTFKNGLYQLRVYPINGANDPTNRRLTSNYLLYDNIGFELSLPPSAPSIQNFTISAPTSSNRTMNISTTLGNPQYNNKGDTVNPTIPPLIETQIVLNLKYNTDDTIGKRIIPIKTNYKTPYTRTFSYSSPPNNRYSFSRQNLYLDASYELITSMKNQENDDFGDTDSSVTRTSINLLNHRFLFNPVSDRYCQLIGTRNYIDGNGAYISSSTNPLIYYVNVVSTKYSTYNLNTENATNLIYNFNHIGTDASGELNIGGIECSYRVIPYGGSSSNFVLNSFTGFNGYNGETNQISQTADIIETTISNGDIFRITSSSNEASKTEQDRGYLIQGTANIELTPINNLQSYFPPSLNIYELKLYTYTDRSSNTENIKFRVDNLSSNAEIDDNNFGTNMTGSYLKYLYGISTLIKVNISGHLTTTNNGKYVLPKNSIISKVSYNDNRFRISSKSYTLTKTLNDVPDISGTLNINDTLQFGNSTRYGQQTSSVSLYLNSYNVFSTSNQVFNLPLSSYYVDSGSFNLNQTNPSYNPVITDTNANYYISNFGNSGKDTMAGLFDNVFDVEGLTFTKIENHENRTFMDSLINDTRTCIAPYINGSYTNRRDDFKDYSEYNKIDGNTTSISLESKHQNKSRYFVCKFDKSSDSLQSLYVNINGNNRQITDSITEINVRIIQAETTSLINSGSSITLPSMRNGNSNRVTRLLNPQSKYVSSNPTNLFTDSTSSYNSIYTSNSKLQTSTINGNNTFFVIVEIPTDNYLQSSSLSGMISLT